MVRDFDRGDDQIFEGLLIKVSANEEKGLGGDPTAGVAAPVRRAARRLKSARRSDRIESFGEIIDMNTQARVVLLVAVFLACGSAAAASWDTARWQAAYAAVPPPPESLERAAHMVGPVKDKIGNLSLGIIDPALLQSHADLQAGLAAMQQSAAAAATHGAAAQSLHQAAGIDIARMQSDPAYAQQMQQKMASMSDAEKMQMAMQFNSTYQQSQQQAITANPQGARAGIELLGQLAQTSQTTASLHRRIGQQMTVISAQYDGQHQAVDAELQSALKACPATYQCGEAGCNPDPQCVSALNARVPGMISRHRKLAEAELADLRKLYTQARAAQQPLVAHIGQLTTAAETAHAGSDKLNSGYASINSESVWLQSLSARATLRAGFWAGIQPRKIEDSYFHGGNLGYAYTLSADDRLDAPPALAKGW